MTALANTATAGVPLAGVRPSGLAAIEARDLYRFFRNGDEETLALRGVSLRVSPGEVVAVVGPSGSGKSTLLGCLAGLDEPAGGAVWVGGERLSHRPEPERARMRARRIGVLMQTNNLMAHLSINDNLRLAHSAGGQPPASSPAALLAAVGLSERGSALPRQLSGGELARAGLAVAMANSPDVLLADEPTGELDGETELRVLSLIRAHAHGGGAVLMVTHSPDVVRFADRVIALQDGRVQS